MKAVQMKQYGGEEELQLVDVAKPTAGKGQVVVRIVATSLNPIDLKRTSGAMKQMFPVQFPFTPGGDVSGVVDSVGEGVKEFKEGDEVWGYAQNGGAYAEFIAIGADKVAPKPKKLNYIETASLALVGQTALQMVDRAEVQKGQTVLIHGAGGAVGSVAVQETHRRGAKVIGTAAKESFERLKGYGADQLIDYEHEAFDKLVRDVDVVLDAVGGETLQRSYGVVKEGGVLVSVVQPPSEEEARKRRIKASMVITETSSASLKRVGDLVAAGAIKPFVGKVYPLSEVAKGWREGRTNHVEGKIVFQVAAEAGRGKGSAAGR